MLRRHITVFTQGCASHGNAGKATPCHRYYFATVEILGKLNSELLAAWPTARLDAILH
jgi:hypothetical protein